ncbi:alpha/beta hydrolase [Pedobacter changchengzhani]|uniref:Alpha/beta hydrolase n=1 Tax=Pedobacter changchengzhani TaxID=2529274 RepID=A0A4R5MIM4_9SPHI|nr:alpha/beta hydrolase [Pedobacter changchengzhani]TDG35362.1 alpha/beta hydrolase [Pedobacter changchengzhani]
MCNFFNQTLNACRKTHKVVLLSVFLFGSLSLSAQTIMDLYKGEIPGSVEANLQEKIEINSDATIFVGNVAKPTLTIFLPNTKKALTSAVIICPGGGYQGLSMTSEGTKVAEQFVKNGVAAFVLKYRLPNDKIMVSKMNGPLQDAQEAILMVKKHAKEWNIDTNKIGIMGFSAGGHLASTAGTHFSGVIKDEAHQFIRPDFMMLIYPVISMEDSLTHGGSKYSLLGKNPSEETKRWFSNEFQVTEKTPPTFIVHAQDDPVVSPKNTLEFYKALYNKKIPTEMHIYPKGGHGFGLDNASTKDRWFDRCINWMQANGWIAATSSTTN